MDNMILFVKLNCSAPTVQPAIDYVKDSYDNQCDRFYYTSETDTQTISDLLDAVPAEKIVGRHIVFIEYRKPSQVFIKYLWAGKIKRLEQEGNSYQIFYGITHKIVSPLVIDNFMRYSTLDISKDFEEDSHISIEDSSALITQLQYALCNPTNRIAVAPIYQHIASENDLSEFAQRNEYCKRIYNILPPSETRGEYQRDYDRIVNSKAFRRTVDKAQIFTSSKGDHYRTRMTHTLCVVQIAKSIASRLRMNVSLTEAIALGHDLGHTPFGHQGERTLDQLARQYADIGFKHNFQSLRVASILEEEYIDCAGLDLSVQVLEGMWKHTKIKKLPAALLVCDIHDFIPQDVSSEILNALHTESSFCSTVEGQIVFIADEIAQRSHDLDDALSAGLLGIEGLTETLSLKKLNTFRSQIEKIRQMIQASGENQRVYVSAQELLISRISAQVIDYFINDVVTNFESFLCTETGAVEEIRNYFEQNKCIDRQLLYFSPEGKALNDYLETIVTKQVINSPEVAAFDDKARRVVTKLFNLYYDNPRLLHDGTLQRIFIEMKKKTENAIHFQDGDINLTNDEWERIKHPENAVRLRDLREAFPDVDLTEYQNLSDLASRYTEDSNEYHCITDYCFDCMEEYTEKRKILVRAICDFISGMTDTYALNEYRKLEY